MPKNPPPAADAQERLIFAIQTIAEDIARLMTVKPDNIPVTDPVGHQVLGMTLVLGRLYWAITGEDFQKLGPKGLLQWAVNLKKRSIITVQ